MNVRCSGRFFNERGNHHAELTINGQHLDTPPTDDVLRQVASLGKKLSTRAALLLPDSRAPPQSSQFG
jgi:hypothetical protein